MGARLSAYTATLKSGPLAVIGLNEKARSAFRRFVNISPAKRPARLFKTEAEARAWLEEAAGQVDDRRIQPFHTPQRRLCFSPPSGPNASGKCQRSTRSSASGLRSCMLKRPA